MPGLKDVCKGKLRVPRGGISRERLCVLWAAELEKDRQTKLTAAQMLPPQAPDVGLRVAGVHCLSGFHLVLVHSLCYPPPPLPCGMGILTLCHCVLVVCNFIIIIFMRLTMKTFFKSWKRLWASEKC